MPSKYFGSTDKTLELKDTTKLQKASLDAFAKELGYEWCNFGKYVAGWSAYCVNEGASRGMLSISLKTMQRWYNYNFIKEAESRPWHGEDVLPEVAEKLGFQVEELVGAINSKLVLTTHLQYSKKMRKLLCTNHQIKIAE